MQSVSTVSSDAYISFMLFLGGETVGCHLSRMDAFLFAKKMEDLIKDQDLGMPLPEFNYETETMDVEVMASASVIMYSIKNKRKDTQTQLAIDDDTSRQLLNSLKNVEESAMKIHGPFNTEVTGPWKFFGIKEE